MCCILGYTAEEFCYIGLVYCDFPLRSLLYPIYVIPGCLLGVLSILICDDLVKEKEKIADTLICVYPYRAGDLCCCWNTPQDKNGPVNLLLWERKINRINKE